jgi:hypothetical protein
LGIGCIYVILETMNRSGLLLGLGLFSQVALGGVGPVEAASRTDARWDRRFAPPGAQGFVWAMAFDHQKIFLGGQMQSVGRVVTEGVVQGDGNHWRNLPEGPQTDFLTLNVLTLALFQGDLYAGGFFDAVGGQAAGGLARWDGKSWSVPAGTNGQVYLLRVDEHALYASGRFALPGSTNPVALARWDGTVWQALTGPAVCATSESCPDEVGSFEIIGPDLFALVNWRRAPQEYYYGLARRGQDGAWSFFSGPAGTNNPLAYYDALSTLQGRLVVAGEFTNASNPAMRNVAQWDGAAWRPIGDGLAGYVVDVAGRGHRLIALHELPGTNASRHYGVSEWNGRHWSALGTNCFGRTESPMRVFIGTKDDVYVVGSFSGNRPVAAASVVRWNGRKWEPLFKGDYEGLAGGIPAVLAFTEHQGGVYLGGSFVTAGDVFSPGIARWDGRQMQGVGGGFTDEPFRVVRSLVSSGELLFAGGSFASIGGVTATNIGAWDGRSWHALGGGLPGTPTTLAWWRGALYAGGFFQPRGGTAPFNFARWDGVGWNFSTLGSNASVSALAVWRDQLYVGGSFTQAGPASVSRLARWDGGQWHDVGGGVFGTGRLSVSRLAAGSDGLYVAGSFTRAGGVAATNIVRWDGTDWHALGEGWRGSVAALTVRGPTVYLGGRMTNDFGEVHRLGRWDGRSWSSPGIDISDARGGSFGRVSALQATDDGLYVGGIFTTAGGKPSAGIARWVERPRLRIGKNPGGPHGRGEIQFGGEHGLNWRWETSTDLQHWFPVDDEDLGDGWNSMLKLKTPTRFFRGVLMP